jgi:uncharacterized protein
MNALASLALYGSIGVAGGFIGDRLKVPSGAMIGAMIAVIALKLLLKSEWEIPKGYGFTLQVLVGVMVGASFHPSLLQTFYKIAIPVVISCIVLVGVGLIMALVFAKLGMMDIGTSYLGTNPGAMTVLLVLADESNVNASVITAFHLFRVIFVVITAPLVYKLLANWL